MPEIMAKHKGLTNKTVYNTMWGPSEFTCMGTLGDYDVYPRLREIRVPTLLVCGEYDTCTPQALYDAQILMPDAKVSVIPNSGHAVYYDNNAGYLSAVTAFLEQEKSRLMLAPDIRGRKP